MNEKLDRPGLSPAAQALYERFAPGEKGAEYYRRGIIPTNNLGLRMLVIDARPGSSLWDFYRKPLFTDDMVERLEGIRANETELWLSSIAAHQVSLESTDQFIASMTQFGIEDERTSAVKELSREAEWRDNELRSHIFEIIDRAGLSEDEAIAYCI